MHYKRVPRLKETKGFHLALPRCASIAIPSRGILAERSDDITLMVAKCA
jgi:hypothetical protein